LTPKKKTQNPKKRKKKRGKKKEKRKENPTTLYEKNQIG
jgi:hypothetical protein